MIAAELFFRPGWWPLLLIAPAVWLVLGLNERMRRRRLEQWIGPRASLLAAERGRRRRAVTRWAYSLGLLLALVAALGPTFGDATEDAGEAHLADVVVCLDVSRSMLARDVAPSRPFVSAGDELAQCRAGALRRRA